VRKLEQRLDFRREAQLAAHVGPEQRLFTGAIARQQQPALAVVPDGEPEHALEPRDGVGSIALVKRNDRFDVAAGAKWIVPSGSGGFAAQIVRVVDLAVAHHPDLAVGALEWLITGGEIHDGEAARADACALMADDALPVGAAMLQRRRHARDVIRIAQRCAPPPPPAVRRYRPEDAAHGPYSPYCPATP